MQLRIIHRTAYRYQEPVKYTAQTLRLTPRREGCQRILSWTIRAPGRLREKMPAVTAAGILFEIQTQVTLDVFQARPPRWYF
jgi:transglutaminase-like putative cysteine protease